MRNLITALFLLLTFSLPQISYADSCSLTKTLYETGKYKKAFKTAKTYASYNNACAKYYLGLMYINGQGVNANNDKGKLLIEEAAKKNFQLAIDYFNNIQP